MDDDRSARPGGFAGLTFEKDWGGHWKQSVAVDYSNVSRYNRLALSATLSYAF